ncbi:MAG: hypothetical protein EAX86_05745 [Candidatus Heimdallarchaeota archaeon]|nr:hypothetical protein [Candidatus Heimdallarchaeota archaeon]
MQIITPSLLRSYLECPRFYYLSHIMKFSLAPNKEHLEDSQLAFQVNELLIRNLSFIMGMNFNNPNHLFDTEIMENLTQKICQAFRFFIKHLTHNQNFSERIQYAFNKMIQASDKLYQGRPSVLIFSSVNSVAIFIHTYRNEYPQSRNFGFTQALMYAYILKSHNYNPVEFIYVNYKTGNLIHKEIQEKHFRELEKTTERFIRNLEEEKFLPIYHSPCLYCEFQILCEQGEIFYGFV